MQILIADSHERVRYALRVMLSRQPGLQVVGKAADGPELLAQAQVAEPGLTLVDWELPGFTALGGPGALYSLTSEATPNAPELLARNAP